MSPLIPEDVLLKEMVFTCIVNFLREPPEASNAAQCRIFIAKGRAPNGQPTWGYGEKSADAADSKSRELEYMVK